MYMHDIGIPFYLENDPHNISFDGKMVSWLMFIIEWISNVNLLSRDKWLTILFLRLCPSMNVSLTEIGRDKLSVSKFDNR